MPLSGAILMLPWAETTYFCINMAVFTYLNITFNSSITIKIFRQEGGAPNFQVEFRDRKGQKLGIFEINQHKFLQKAIYLLYTLCLNGSKGCLYSVAYMKYHIFFGTQEVLQKFQVQKWGANFSKLDLEIKEGTKAFYIMG